MAIYHGASICRNGHVISKYDANAQKHCSICGAEIRSCCSSCNAPIRGLPELNALYLGDRPYTRPNYCHECGSPYPWIEKVIDSAIELIALDIDLDDTTREIIKNSIPDLLVDSPITPVAVAKYKFGISKASQLIKDSCYNLLVDVLSETAKKTFFD